jgi:hypothetical protein
MIPMKKMKKKKNNEVVNIFNQYIEVTVSSHKVEIFLQVYY